MDDLSSAFDIKPSASALEPEPVSETDVTYLLYMVSTRLIRSRGPVFKSNWEWPAVALVMEANSLCILRIRLVLSARAARQK
jgi:hypothetical protein